MRIMRAIVGLLLIPVGAALTLTILALVAGLGSAPGLAQLLPSLVLGGGVVLWAIVFLFMPRPVRVYVLAHELTHALWGAMAGARVSGLKVSRSGGSVCISEVNWLTALAPYFFPFYTVVVLLVYGLLALVLDMRRWEMLWLGLIGLTLGFHWCFTLNSLAQSQSDIRRYGCLFSYSLIYLFNLLLIGLVLVLTAPLTFEQFGTRLIGDIIRVYQVCGLATIAVFRWLQQVLSGGVGG